AMLLVGMKIETAPGTPLVDDTMLNGVVTMILFTCIISSMVTEFAAKRIILKGGITSRDDTAKGDDERILLPVKYQEIADGLISLAAMMRNTKLNREVVAVNVVYDDEKRKDNQAKGHILLENLRRKASAADINVETQVRVAANIANGIKHAFKEYNASEIIMGMHIHRNISPKFWGEFAQSLYNGLSRQITFVRLKQPLNTLRRIQVAVPSRAEYEQGFYRWVERLARLAENTDCRIQFHGRNESLQLIREYINNRHSAVRAEYTFMSHWNELPRLASTISEDHMFVVVTARKGTVSYKSALERLPDEIERHFSGKTIMILFPDQNGKQMDSMTFAESQHQEEMSAYQMLTEWIRRKF
ncbi:MAG: cation:proton antiporter, partial [Prevotella sp.]|nr:cation:proton antiporter [Prevotella sp.]